MSGPYGIVTALSEEAAPLRARLVGAERCTLLAGRAWRGELAGVPVALMQTGEGATRARRGVEALLAAVPAIRALLVSGVAAGAGGPLAAEALVVAREVHAGEAVCLTAPGDLVALTVAATGARPSVIVSAPRLVSLPQEKRALAERHGSRDREGEVNVAIDLESAACAAVATRAGRPWVVLRAISDTADEPLPSLLGACQDGEGRVRRVRVLRGLLGQPTAVAALLALRARVHRCARQLAEAVERLLPALAAAPEAGWDVTRCRHTKGEFR